MNTPESDNNGVLQVSPPNIVGATEPVVGAILGVSMLIHSPGTGGVEATVRVDPPLSGTVEKGDVIRLRLVGETAILDSHIFEDVDATVFMRIPYGRLPFDSVFGLYCDIVRGSQNMATSATVTGLYNKIRPGLKDTEPLVEGHSELKLLLPEEILKGVAADFVSAQVCFRYPYCRAYDLITLKCNGQSLPTPFRVSADQAAPPPYPGSAVPTTVCFTLTRAFLDSVPQRPDKTLEFAYTVTDQLGNTVDPDALWSASQIVEENLDGTRFLPLIYREVPSESGDVSETIDLSKLDRNPLSLIVLTNDRRMRPGDIINVIYIARVPGQPDEVVKVSGEIEADAFGQNRPCVLQVPYDRVIPGSAVTSNYEVVRGGVRIGIASSALAQVVGEARPDLQQPRFQRSVNGVYDPDDPANVDGANLQVELLGFLPGDRVQPFFEQPSGAGVPSFEAKALNANSRANYPVDKQFIENHRGETFTLFYLLYRNGQTYKSPPLSVVIKEAAARVAPLVIGSRGTTMRYWSNKGSSRLLTALDPVSLKPVETVWQYEGDSQSFRGSRFDDRQPRRLLRVGSGQFQVLLQRANLFGNGWGDPATPDEAHAAFVALRDAGSLVAWGLGRYGGTLPADIGGLGDVIDVVGGSRAMALLRANNTVKAWGDVDYGGVLSPEVAGLTDVVSVTAGGYGGAVVRSNGQLAAWGDARFGGSVPGDIALMADIVSIGATVSAFVALRTNGQIVAWGDSRFGGSLPTGIAALRDVSAVTCNHNACVALRANGTVVGWGEGVSGGTVPPEIARLNDIVEVISSGSAFAALLADRRVVAWGNPEAGGVVPGRIAAYTNVIEIIGGGYGFAVRLDNHQIDTWGDSAQGGLVPASVARRTDVMQIASTNGAYAVLYADGTAEAFGNPVWGGDTRSVANQLSGVRSITGNAQAFAFLTLDRRLITAGLPEGGGNSDAVQGPLFRQLSYQLN
ncbi:RCC1 domain-containing protein [Pseudomonas sp. NPDC087803]|uniref:RCC1 domain-containing protein n=1 Tax=Pseudomonas sp. NPDC087803 TaxID=3364448 RepID=UPI00382778DB